MAQRTRLFLLSALSFVACQPASTMPDASTDGAVHVGVEFPLVDPAERDASDRTDLVTSLERGESRVVLVLVDDASPSRAIAAGAVSVRARVSELVAPSDVLLIAQHLPVLALRVRDAATLAAIEGTAGVLRVEPERILSTTSPSLDLIGQPAALARGADGRGLSVAVLDTGVDFTHADLGGCTAAGDGCPVVFARDFAADDGTRDDTRRHGTNVAAIVRSVAPSTSILALDVFTGTGASSVHITAALDWVIANRDTYHIVAANMSLGYGAFTAACPGEVLSAVMQRVRDAGIIPVIATGNDGFTNAIASPGCAPAAVSVGAVDATNAVASFSNSASFVSLLAPGVYVTGGGVTMSGTSQATPHVAGAFAALRTAYPSDAVGDAIARLVGSGVATTDSRNGRVLPRLSIDAATAGGATAPPPDLTAPTGTLTLPGLYTRTTSVAYSIAASDAVGVTRMCMSAATTCTTFVSFSATGTFTLPTGDGLKTLRVWLRDAAGNTSAPITATITLDARTPTTGAVTAAAGIGRVTLSVATSTDTGSGIAGYRAVFSTGASAPSNCATGEALPDSTSATIVHEGLTNGTTYRYRVCALDRAGNVSAGATALARPVLELDPPTGTMVLEGGAAWARSTRVTATLTATDASAVTHVCISANATCSSWVAFAGAVTTTLASGAGPRTMNAWFRDTWGNVSTAPASDGISLDTVAPTEVTALSVTRGDASLALTWSAVSDVTSGVSGYLVAYLEGTTAPTTCVGGVSVTAPSATISSLVNGRPVAYRVCGVDVAGNTTRGVAGTAVPAPEIVPPTGSITIAGDAAFTGTRSVTLALTASDPSGPLSMCVTTAATCTAWVPFAEPLAFTLGTTQGLQTVRAWLRDAYGNATTTPVTDTIALDTTAPTNPPVTATARSGGVDLSIGSATDAGSGVASYVVVSAPGTRAPTSCASATEVTASPRTASITASVQTGWRVCAVDAMGNRSTGTSGVTTPLP